MNDSSYVVIDDPGFSPDANHLEWFSNTFSKRLCDEFLANGIVKIPVEDMGALNRIHLNVLNCKSIQLTNETLNNQRMDIINRMNSCDWFRNAYFSLAKRGIETLAGNELVMQRNINLSIQLPGDDSSLLPRHQDSLQGDSPYEIVLWVPLVDCYDTKAMFFQKRNSDVEEFIDCKYGECLIFSPNFWHGNVVNQTNETRWSMNCRFKSALTPYGDKKLGEFFEPIFIRPATRLGSEYVPPKI